jgi:hypothetical protein
MRRARGELAAALAELELARATIAAIAAEDPSNPYKQHDLAYAHETIGDTLVLMKDGVRAREAYLAQRAVFAGLAEAHPDDPTWKRGLAVVHDKVGNALMVEGDRAAAAAEYRACIAIFEELAAAAPGVHDADLAEARGHLEAAERR